MAELTLADFLAWLTPQAAIASIAAASEEERKRAIITRVTVGSIRAVGNRTEFRGEHAGSSHLAVVEPRLWMPPWQRAEDDFWAFGDITFVDQPNPYEQLVHHYKHRPGRVTVREVFTGVRLRPADVIREFGSLSTNEPTSKGRKPASWWEDFWIEICRQLYCGDLKPSSQSVIERAMHDWISAHGYEAGDTTVRDRARRLIRALREEDGN